MLSPRLAERETSTVTVCPALLNIHIDTLYTRFAMSIVCVSRTDTRCKLQAGRDGQLKTTCGPVQRDWAHLCVACYRRSSLDLRFMYATYLLGQLTALRGYKPLLHGLLCQLSTSR
jgi:hypothetical protein